MCIRLAARIFWRMDKEGGIASDLQLTSIDDLEDHVSDMPEEDLKQLKIDIHNFLDYWPRNSKPHNVDDISHILGVVRLTQHSKPMMTMSERTFVSSIKLTLILTSQDKLQWLHCQWPEGLASCRSGPLPQPLPSQSQLLAQLHSHSQPWQVSTGSEPVCVLQLRPCRLWEWGQWGGDGVWVVVMGGDQSRE